MAEHPGIALTPVKFIMLEREASEEAEAYLSDCVERGKERVTFEESGWEQRGCDWSIEGYEQVRFGCSWDEGTNSAARE